MNNHQQIQTFTNSIAYSSMYRNLNIEDMTRKPTTFDNLPQAIDLLFQRLDEIEAKVENQNKSRSNITYIQIREAAALIGKTTTTIYKLAQAGKIPAYKNGKQWSFKKEELEAWMTRMPTQKVSYLPTSNNEVGATAVQQLMVKPKTGRSAKPFTF